MRSIALPCALRRAPQRAHRAPLTPAVPTRLLIPLLLLAALFVCGRAIAQDDGPRIGVVNAERLLIESDAAKAAQARIEREFGERDRALRAQRGVIQDMQASLARERSGMTAFDSASREDEIAVRQRALQREETRYRDALNERRIEEVRRLKQLADEAVRRVAIDESLDLVLQDVLYAGARVDITAKVLKVLRAP